MYNQLVRGSIRENYEMKGNAVDHYETLNEVLVKLFRDIMDIEQKAIITQEFKDITNNDMHVIEAIGDRSAEKYVLYRQRAVSDGGYPYNCNEQSCKERLCGENTRPGRQEGRVYIPFRKRQKSLRASCPVPQGNDKQRNQRAYQR